MPSNYDVGLKKLAVPLISLVILTTLILQLSVTMLARGAAYSVTEAARASAYNEFPPLHAVYQGVLADPKIWPFLGYPMFSYNHQVGDEISRYSVYGTLEDSTVVPILPQDLGVNHWHFKHLQRALENKDEAKIQNWVEIYQSRHSGHSGRLVGLRMENHPLVFSKEGMEPREPQVVARWEAQ